MEKFSVCKKKCFEKALIKRCLCKSEFVSNSLNAGCRFTTRSILYQFISILTVSSRRSYGLIDREADHTQRLWSWAFVMWACWSALVAKLESWTWAGQIRSIAWWEVEFVLFQASHHHNSNLYKPRLTQCWNGSPLCVCVMRCHCRELCPV